MSLEELRRRAEKLEKKIYWRNAREYLASLSVVVLCAFQLWRATDALIRAGLGLMIAGMVFMVWQLHRQGSSRALPAGMGSDSSVEFFRRELVRQRDMLQRVWRWYLAPLVPGLAVLMIAYARINPRHRQHPAWLEAGYGLLVTLAFTGIAWLNKRGARRLERRIDELDAMQVER